MMDYLTDRTDLKRVYLWTTGRSLSTVLLKCLSHVPDCQIVNSLFTSCFLFGGGPSLEHQSCFKEKDVKEEACQDLTDFRYLFESSTSTYPWAKSRLESDFPGKKYIICKDLAFVMSGYHSFIPKGFRHTFLIRHPYRMFQSWKNSLSVKNLPLSDMHDIVNTYYKKHFNYKELCEVLQYLQEHPQLGDQSPVVIDADDLQNHPASVLSQYCEAVGIPYTDDLLQWKPGFDEVKTWMASRKLVIDGLFGWRCWESAMKSSHFIPANKLPDRSELSGDILTCADISMPYYEKLYSMRTFVP